MMNNVSYKTKMCFAEFKGFAPLCLCHRVRIRNFVFPALVTAFSPRALLGFGVFKLRRALVRKVPIANLVKPHCNSYTILRAMAQLGRTVIFIKFPLFIIYLIAITLSYKKENEKKPNRNKAIRFLNGSYFTTEQIFVAKSPYSIYQVN